MTEESFKRKLTAILSADVEGYSRLMGEDEDATIRTLTSYRELMSSLIQKHRGRVVDSPGDNLLAEFLSVVDAVRCAVEIQEELRIRNAELPESRRMHFRIGINLGDVVEEEERIYGDGINIAARVEGLADGGGICISGTVYDSIKNKLTLSYESIGEHTVKNIKEPVRVYRMRVGPEAEVKPRPRRWRRTGLVAVAVLVVAAGAWAIWNFYFRPPPIEPASVEKMAYPLPEKSSIAVLPFTNMSGDSKEDYFSDGLTDQIISTISKLGNLFVIARNSTFTYKGKPVKIQKVAEDLGVKYVLEGSVQRTADRIRITAQLIDAITGHHLWSERYDRERGDLFAIQDDIAMQITKALRVELTEGEQARIWGKHETGNLKAYEKVLQGRQYASKGTKEDSTHAFELFKEAIALDPGYARAYAGLGLTHFFCARFGWAESRTESIKMAFKCAQKAIDLDETLDMAHILIGSVYLVKRQYEKAIDKMERAVALNPNGADAYSTLAGTLGCSGRWEESIVFAKKSIRLNPFPPAFFFHWLGRAYFMTGQYDESIPTFKKALHVSPNYLPAHAFLAACYSASNRQAEAESAVKEILRINPKFTLESYAKTLPYKNKVDRERYIAALRKAGLPETPPLPLPDKPSIAVLPFRNLSGDPAQEFLSDGFTEDIITTLAKIPRMFVIARESSFTYKGKSAKAQDVGRDLGVRYILEGSIQKSGDRVRISAQLINAQNGHHLWAEKFDRDEQEIFKLRDDVIKEIAVALEIKLTEGAWLTGWGGITENFDAYIKVRQSLEHFRRFTPDENILSRQKAKEALKLDLNYSAAMQMVSWTLLMDGMYGTSKTPEKSIEQAFKLAHTALDNGDDDAGAHYLLGFAYIQKGQFEKGVSEVKIARDLSPNSAEINAGLGMILSDAGRPMEAIAPLRKAMRLNPIPPSWYFSNLGGAYLNTEQYEKASLEFKKALERQPDHMFAHLNLVVCYVNLNRHEDAYAEAAEVLRIDPEFSINRYIKNFRFADQAVKQRRIDAMRKAGLPE